MLTQLCWQPCSCSMHMSTPARQKGHQSGPQARQMHGDSGSGMHPFQPQHSPTDFQCMDTDTAQGRFLNCLYLSTKSTLNIN